MEGWGSTILVYDVEYLFPQILNKKVVNKL